MTIGYVRFQRLTLTEDETEVVNIVDGLASRLRLELEQQSALVDAAHVHGASSSKVQAIVSEILKAQLGFKEEVLLTAQDGVVSKARPDFYFALGPEQGVIAEVERGGTVTNNHDLKDIWKAHISPDTQHLFLVVPNSNWNEAGGTRERPFVRVTHRLGAFFGDSRREIDVLTCHVFGYGRNTLSEAPATLSGD
jgi:hypothetical protein